MENNIINTLNMVIQVLNTTPITGVKNMANIASCAKLLEDIATYLGNCDIIQKPIKEDNKE